jgi:hypothetical protein
MAYHRTASGAIDLVDEWGHGRNARGDWSFAPATIVVDDGDGHYSAWRYTGRKRDAIATAARFLRAPDPMVIVCFGNDVYPVGRADWVDGVDELTDYEYRYHPHRQPGGVCMAWG